MVDDLSAFTTYVFRVSAVTVAEGPYTETDAVLTVESSMYELAFLLGVKYV